MIKRLKIIFCSLTPCLHSMRKRAFQSNANRQLADRCEQKDRQTPMAEIITFPQLRWRAVKWYSQNQTLQRRVHLSLGFHELSTFVSKNANPLFVLCLFVSLLPSSSAVSTCSPLTSLLILVTGNARSSSLDSSFAKFSCKCTDEAAIVFQCYEFTQQSVGVFSLCLTPCQVSPSSI